MDKEIVAELVLQAKHLLRYEDCDTDDRLIMCDESVMELVEVTEKEYTRLTLRYMWSLVQCLFKGHDMIEHVDRESGSTQFECQRCGWSSEVYYW